MPLKTPFTRNRIIHVLPLLVLALSAAACAAANAPSDAPLADDGVEGVWMHQERTGYRETMTLTIHGYDVRGEGTYRMEGGVEGTTTILGSWRYGKLALSIIRDTGIRERWTGRLTRGRLRGEMVWETPPQHQHRRFGFDRPGAVPRLR